MSRTDWSTASGRYLTSATPPITAYPFSFSAWFYLTASGSQRDIVGCYYSGSSGSLNQFSMRANTGDALAINVGTASTNTTAVTSATISLNAWHHGLAVGASATSRAIYLDGGSKGTSTANRTPANIDRAAIGFRYSTSVDSAWSATGMIAEVAVWNVALGDADAVSLAKGIPAWLVRPDALVAYWPLIGNSSPEPDFVGRLDMTVGGALAKAEQPKLFYPSRRLIVPAAAAAANVIGIGLTRSQRLQPRRLVA